MWAKVYLPSMFMFVHLCYFVFIGKLWKPSLVDGEGDLNLAFLQGQAQRRVLLSICLIELWNCVLSAREVCANTSLQRIKNPNKRLAVRKNVFIFIKRWLLTFPKCFSGRIPYLEPVIRKQQLRFKAVCLEKQSSWRVHLNEMYMCLVALLGESLSVMPSVLLPTPRNWLNIFFPVWRGPVPS